MSLPATALGIAIAEADWDVREETPNSSPRIREYLRGVNPPINVAAPWCAAFTNYCADQAASAIGVQNPLDAVHHEALVQSIVNWAREHDRQTFSPQPGDLIAFKFGSSNRWNHIGFVLREPDRHGRIQTVEGNTSDPDGQDREGVYFKTRWSSRQPTFFIRWSGC